MFPDPIIQIGENIKIYWYGLLIAVGLVIALTLVLSLYSKRLGASQRDVDFTFYNLILCIPLGFGVAALAQSTYSYIEALQRGEDAVFKYTGITAISGILGGAAIFLLVYFLLRKRLKLDLLAVLPVIPCMITVAHAFGRIGCFMAGCCYGKSTDSIFGVKFPGMKEAVHPTQLYEAIFLFLLFGLLSYMLLKKRFMYTMSLYLVSYGVFRFAVEFLRGDDRGAFLGIFSPSQFWSLFMILLGIGVYFLEKHFREKASIQE